MFLGSRFLTLMQSFRMHPLSYEYICNSCTILASNSWVVTFSVCQKRHRCQYPKNQFMRSSRSTATCKVGNTRLAGRVTSIRFPNAAQVKRSHHIKQSVQLTCGHGMLLTVLASLEILFKELQPTFWSHLLLNVNEGNNNCFHVAAAWHFNCCCGFQSATFSSCHHFL